MFSRLEDELLDHPKISVAGQEIGGKNGRVIAIGFYAMALMWSNRHLTDGVLPLAAIETFRSHVGDPLAVADAFVRAGLFDKTETVGHSPKPDRAFRIHDFREFNPSAAAIKKKRREDRERKAAEKANGRARA